MAKGDRKQQATATCGQEAIDGPQTGKPKDVMAHPMREEDSVWMLAVIGLATPSVAYAQGSTLIAEHVGARAPTGAQGHP